MIASKRYVQFFFVLRCLHFKLTFSPNSILANGYFSTAHVFVSKHFKPMPWILFACTWECVFVCLCCFHAWEALYQFGWSRESEYVDSMCGGRAAPWANTYQKHLSYHSQHAHTQTHTTIAFDRRKNLHRTEKKITHKYRYRSETWELYKSIAILKRHL